MAVLCGRDIISNAQAVARYLKGEEGMDCRGKGANLDIDVVWFKDLNHAQVFDKKRNRECIVKVAREYCKLGA